MNLDQINQRRPAKDEQMPPVNGSCFQRLFRLSCSVVKFPPQCQVTPSATKPRVFRRNRESNTERPRSTGPKTSGVVNHRDDPQAVTARNVDLIALNPQNWCMCPWSFSLGTANNLKLAESRGRLLSPLLVSSTAIGISDIWDHATI